jgi:hypothetical protein
MIEPCWKYKGKCLDSPPEGYYGFIYKIIDDTGKIYIGKKAFSHKRKRNLTKKERVGTRKKIEYVYKDSDWIHYWGSSKPLLEYIKERGGTQGFKRQILRLCEDRTSWSYWEMDYLFKEKVLFREDCWNGNIVGKFYKGKIK